MTNPILDKNPIEIIDQMKKEFEDFQNFLKQLLKDNSNMFKDLENKLDKKDRDNL
jgi:hypothetical protein